MIGNAHIDPAWLWRLTAGVGEVLSTCRTVCDLLDREPGFIFTRSDVWVYERVESLDPELFQRILRHIAEGRWAVVGGWYIQPDCNLPRGDSFQKHIEVGRRYSKDRLGVTATVGYNVDSFGHAASLPRILSDNGYDSYVMMRPGAHEMVLPSALFRWQSPPEAGGGGSVVVWRIPSAYGTGAADLSDQVRAALAAAVPGIDHVMCFYGVGDHGGGPTLEQIRWIREHERSFDGARLLFSHPRAFFDAVRGSAGSLPLVVGELQMHAVGCYTVGRRIKEEMRRAEHGIHMAETAVRAFPDSAPVEAAAELGRAWSHALFNQFHDIYGGTCIPPACDDAVAQLASARETARSVAYNTLFRHAVSLPPARRQRVVAFNGSQRPFKGFIRWEPWMGWGKPFDGWISDENDSPVLSQVVSSSSVSGLWGALLWPAQMGPGSLRQFRLQSKPGPRLPASDVRAGESIIESGSWTAGPGSGGSLLAIQNRVGGPLIAAPGIRLVLMEDLSDTWSHGVRGYEGKTVGEFSVQAVTLEESGPVRATLRVDAKAENSSLTLFARVYSGDPRLELELLIDWRERLRLAKLVFTLAGPVASRLDGIPGGALNRAQDGRELPLLDWSLAGLPGGRSLGFAAPDCSALDGRGDALRFTLLRSPVYAWHIPTVLPPGRAYPFMDQGEHRFRFLLVPDASPSVVEDLALSEHRAPLCIDWTKGMGDGA